MFEHISPVVNFSPFGGQLIEDIVKGSVNGKINPENDVKTVAGEDRTMYTYVPASGVYHAKQTQVLYVLRSDDTKDSAEKLLSELKLKELAEERHFILLFPNPINGKWNYSEDQQQQNDTEFLIRCFAALPKSQGKCAGFNGMMFYIGTDESSSAMAMTLAARTPLNAAALMIGKFPDTYIIPVGTKAEQTAFVYDNNKEATKYFASVNGECSVKDNTYTQNKNPNVFYMVSDKKLDAALVKQAWDDMFSITRRWRNDTYGIYQPRIDFEKEGFVAHINDKSLKDNDNFAHTWFEYVPNGIKSTQKKVPMIIYFHGINCVGLYGAEQSGWSRIAKENNMIAVFPNPSIEERWNVWDDRRLPSDMDYIIALIEHMKQVHPIDESRIYISGFSMGSMFTNAFAAAYPELFAGALACNGPQLGYLQTLDSSKQGMIMMRPTTMIKDIPDSKEAFSPVHIMSDDKKEKYDYHMPFVQFVGMLDNVGFYDMKKRWPVTNKEDNSWIDTICFWQKFNDIPVHKPLFDALTETGIGADMCVAENEHIVHQTWKDAEGDTLYHLYSVKRCPHAVVLDGIEMGWNIIRHYHRNQDGSLSKD